MAIKPRQFQEGIVLKEKTTSLDTEGQLANKDSKIKAYTDGAEREVVTNDQTQTLTNKDIDADNNTISNIETDNLKAGVLNTDLSGAATDTEIPSALAVKTALEGQNEASEVEYDPASNPETSATNVQDALDDTGIASQAAQDAIDAHIADATDAHDASAISNVPSGNLAATDVQGALDELQTDVDTRATDADLQAHINDTTDAHDASAISNTPSGNLAATDVQGALDELQTDVDTRATDADLTAHTSASSGVHGVTGDVVGTTDTQTLTNKTIQGASIEDPTRLDVKKDTFANLETYALTATDGQFVFATDTKQMLQIVDNALVPVGSGSGGGIDVYFTERFEQTVAADLSSGNNATFLGGGSLAGSLADDESTPIKGDRSITYTQAVGSANDYVALPNIELSLKEKDNVSGIKVYTIYDGNDSEIDFVVWDVTNSMELARVPIKASTKALEHQAIFETQASTDNITCGFQVILENDGAVLEFDEIEAKVNPFETTDIYASSEWTEYTPTTQGFGTPSDVKFYWRRQGQNLEVYGSLTTGTVTATECQIHLPDDLVIEQPSLASIAQTVGVYIRNTTASTSAFTVLSTNGDTFVNFGFSSGGGVSAPTDPKNGSQLFGNSEEVSFRWSVPIAGWSNVRQGVTVKNTTSTEDWNNFSPTFTGIGTPTIQNAQYKVEGDSLFLNLKVTTGTVTATDFTMLLPNGYTIKSADTSTVLRFGHVEREGVLTDETMNVIGVGGDNFLQVGLRNSSAANNGFTEGLDGNTLFGSAAPFSINAIIPINEGSASDRVYTVPVGFKESEHYLSDFNSNFWDDTGQILTWDSSLIKDAVRLSNSPNIEISNGTTPDGTATRIVAKQPIDLAISAMGNVVVGNGVFIKNSSGENLTYSIRNDGSNNYTTDTAVTKLNTGDYIYLRSTNAASREGLVTIWAKPSREDGVWVGKFGYETAYIKDVKPSGTDGGTSSATPVARDLNTLTGDTSFVSLSSNEFTLDAGVYDIEWSTPAYKSGRHQSALYNVTDATYVDMGSTEYSETSSNIQTSSKGATRVILSESKSFSIYHEVESSNATNGFGVSAGGSLTITQNEIYSQVKIVKKR